MQPLQRLDDERVRYFAPDQLMLLVEHAEPPSPDQFDELIKRLNGDIDAARIELPRRVLTFPRTEERLGFSLVFADIPEGDDEAERLLSVVDRLNQARSDQPIVSNLALRLASPNWVASGAPHAVTGGPGARPAPAGPLPHSWRTAAVDTPGAPFGFKIDAVPRGGETEVEVEVAILDTVPCLHELVYAYATWQAEHPLIRSLLRPGGRLLVHYASYAELVRLAQYVLGEHAYPMPDHGLFAAGIIHTLAPRARLHLIEVLNPYGVGDLESIALGLWRLLQRRSELPLVVNCSLVLNLPLPGHPKQALNWNELETDQQLVAQMGWPLQWICDALRSRNAVLVAAAGNDGQNGQRPQARYPAALDGVVGVAALQDDQTPASYSNLADAPAKIGIATFGGDMHDDSERSGTGVLGVYTGAFPDGQLNTSGWACWAGTSFAAPVISGVAAAFLGHGTSVNDLVNELYSIQGNTTTAQEEIVAAKQGA